MDLPEAALTSLNFQEALNILTTAKEFGVVESTLRRKFRDQTISIQQTKFDIHTRFSQPQERALINQINRLTDRGIPPTTRMVKNFAEEIIKDNVNKN